MKKHVIPFLMLSGIVAAVHTYGRHLEKETENEQKVEKYKGNFNLNSIPRTSGAESLNLKSSGNTNIDLESNRKVSNTKDSLTNKSKASPQDKHFHIRLHGDSFDFSILTVDDLKNCGWHAHKETVSARYKDGVHIWMQREASSEIFDTDCIGNCIQSFSISDREKNNLKGKFFVGESITFGSTEEDIRKEFGKPKDVTDMSQYGYKILLYSDDNYVLTFNVNKESGLSYFSIDKR